VVSVFVLLVDELAESLLCVAICATLEYCEAAAVLEFTIPLMDILISLFARNAAGLPLANQAHHCYRNSHSSRRMVPCRSCEPIGWQTYSF
jgi:hypothetical protein